MTSYHSHPGSAEHLTYTVGELPEYAQQLQDLAANLSAAIASNIEEDLPLPNIHGLQPGAGEQPINPENIEIFPVGTGPSIGERAAPGQHRDGEEIVDEKDIEILRGIADAWGNGSDIYGVRFGESTDGDKAKNPHEYFVTLLRDEAGEVVAFVADTRKVKHGMYIWRADASAALTHIEALSYSRREFVDDGVNGRQIRHRGDVDQRVLDILTMDADDYMAMRDKERAGAAALREQRRHLGQTAIEESVESSPTDEEI